MKHIKKIIIALILLVFFTGCEGNYTLTIDEDTFHEEMNVMSYDAGYFDAADETGYTIRSEFEKAKDANTPAYYDSQTSPEIIGRVDGISYYGKKYTASDEMLKLNYNFDSDYKNYDRSTIIRQFFPEFSMVEEAGTIKLYSGVACNIFYYYPMLTKVTINITTDYVVRDSNATKKEGNTYTWTLTKDDVSSRKIHNPLILRYAKVKEKADLTWIVYIVLFIFALAFIGIIAIIFARSHAKKMDV